MTTVDLGRHRSSPNGRVFSGRERGASVRKEAGLETLDKDPGEVVVVRVPDDVYSVNVSFFLALFGPSIVKLGSKENFLKKYRFEGPEHVMTDISTGVDYALKQSSALAHWR